MEKIPSDFDYHALDLNKEWSRWRQAFSIYLIATKKNEEKDAIKIAILLNQLGAKGIQIYNTFDVKYEKFDEVIQEFNKYFQPKINILYERFKFNKITIQDQPLPEFITLLKVQAEHCDFSEKNNMIRDKILQNIKDETLINRLLDEGNNLSLERMVEIINLNEERNKEIRYIKNEEVNAIKENSHKHQFKKSSFPGKPYSLQLKPDAIPVTHNARRIPKSLMPKLKSTLKNLEEQQVIKKVEGPSEWLHPLLAF
ncbi:hypothetical protein ACJJTC_012397 [Scirpophaga incertulas]